MKKLCTLILTLFCLASLPVMAAESETGFWFEAGTASGKNPGWLTGYYDHNFANSNFGLYALAEKESDGYREFYVGPKWKPLEWLEVGAGVGRETLPHKTSSYRHNAFVSINTDKVTAFVTYENGESGSWHKAYALYKATETVSAGAMDETSLGFGPRVEYTIAKNVTVWGALLREHNKTTSLFAINFSF